MGNFWLAIGCFLYFCIGLLFAEEGGDRRYPIKTISIVLFWPLYFLCLVAFAIYYYFFRRKRMK